jgi:hypothetical protein
MHLNFSEHSTKCHSIYSDLSYFLNPEYIVISPILIHYHKFILDFPLSLFINSFSNSEKHGFHFLKCIYLFSPIMYIKNTRIVNLHFYKIQTYKLEYSTIFVYKKELVIFFWMK